jgi:N-methylhydantoinase A
MPEITNWSLTVASRAPEPAPVARLTGGSPATPRRIRRVFDAGLRQEVEAVEVARADMTPGRVVSGPAIITEDETSTIVTAAFRAIGQADGCLLLIRKEGGA